MVDYFVRYFASSRSVKYGSWIPVASSLMLYEWQEFLPPKDDSCYRFLENSEDGSSLGLTIRGSDRSCLIFGSLRSFLNPSVESPYMFYRAFDLSSGTFCSAASTDKFRYLRRNLRGRMSDDFFV